MKQPRNLASQNKTLFISELPYPHVTYIIAAHGQFNNLLENDIEKLPTKRYLEKLHSLYDLDIFSLNTSQNSNINPDFQYNNQICANYYLPSCFNDLKKHLKIHPFQLYIIILEVCNCT